MGFSPSLSRKLFGGRFFVVASVFYSMYSEIQAKMPRKIPISVRLNPEVKACADKMAKKQNRTLTNLIETLLQEACQKQGK